MHRGLGVLPILIFVVRVGSHEVEVLGLEALAAVVRHEHCQRAGLRAPAYDVARATVEGKRDAESALRERWDRRSKQLVLRSRRVRRAWLRLAGCVVRRRFAPE